MPELKKFSYQININAIPYIPENVEYLYQFGPNYMPDYPEDSMAKEILHDMIQDAISRVLEKKMNLLSKTKKSPEEMDEREKAYWDYLEERYAQYKQIQESIGYDQ